MFTIPSGAIQAFQDGMDAFLADGFAHIGTLVYAPKLISNSEHVDDPIGNKPNISTLSGRTVPYFGHPAGGPSSGDDMIEQEVTEQINMRVYWLTTTQIQKNKQLMEAGVDWKTTVIQTKFWVKDMNKVLRSQYLRFDADEKLHAFREYRFTLFGEPILMGFNQNRYALATWTRSQ